jgi:hypothetical protein
VLRLLSLLASLAPADTNPAIRPPRIEATVEVDGVLDEPVWREAAVVTGFHRYLPDAGVATDSTVVLVWYSPTAIHFGIRAWEAHGSVIATLADRDRIFGDDNVQFFLSTYNDGRQAVVLATNPFGIQADGALVETGRTNGTGAVGGREPTDLSPDYVWQSKGRLIPGGFEVEIRVPFKSLRYQSADVQSWGFNVIRKVQHAGAEDSWTAAQRDAASFLAQGGQLEGLTEMRRGLVVDITPELTQTWDGLPAADGWDYTARDWNLGGTVRWGVTENLTLNGTVRPDFSQVEADAAQVQFDPRVALFYPERRPFFLDGLELFNAPNNLIYTRTLVQPDGAAKLTGKAAGTDIGIIAGVDGEDFSLTGDEHPWVFMGRVQRDIGESSRLGVVYTARREDAGTNQVAGVDGRWVFGRIYALQFQVAGSHTEVGTQSVNAPLWQARFNRSGRRVGIRAGINGISDDFETWSGFIGRAGIVNAFFNPGYTWSFAQTDFLQRFTTDFRLDGTYQYENFVNGEQVQDQKYHINTTSLLRGGWNIGAGVYIEAFGWDEDLYANYRLLQDDGLGGIDTVAYTGTPRIENLDWYLSMSTPAFQNFNANFYALYGHDENFYEWSSAWLSILNGGLNWRPTEQIRAGLTYSYQRVVRRSDNSLVNTTHLPRLTLEYQLARPLFLRFIGQYVTSETDSLRDDSRTELPIYVDRGGTLVRAAARAVNDIRGDVLVSYRPNPGTVFFLGYGSSAVLEDRMKFASAERTKDAFFVKLSYLFRL